jgi:hypothetical protein
MNYEEEQAMLETKVVTKTHLTTDQYIKVYKSLSDEKSRELSKAWYASRDTAWYAARDADLAILVKDKITAEQFKILTSPWTSCGLSLYAEDWDEVLSPPVTEPKGFGAIVEAWYETFTNKREKAHFFNNGGDWILRNTLYNSDWSDLINPIIISEGIEG